MVCVGWLGLLFPLCAEKFLWVREIIHSNNSALNHCFQQAQLMHGCRRSACPDLPLSRPLHGGGTGLMIKADIALVSVQLLDKHRGTALSWTLSVPGSYLCRISYIEWNLWEVGIYCSNLLYLYLWEELQGVLVMPLTRRRGLLMYYK